MPLTTERTFLRRFQMADLENMRLLESEPEIMKMTPMKVPQTFEQTRTRLEKLVANESVGDDYGVWAAFVKQTFIGWFMLMRSRETSCEIGFMLVKNAWGHGFASEISKALVSHAFGVLGAESVVAKTLPENSRSIHVLSKLGFQFQKVSEAGLNLYELLA